MSAEPIDFAAVKAEHEGHVWGELGLGMFSCFPAERLEHGDRCTPYRLAVEAERLAGKVTRVEEQALYLAGQYGRLLAAHEQVVMDTPEDRALHARVVAAFRAALPGLNAALADQHEQVQP